MRLRMQSVVDTLVLSILSFATLRFVIKQVFDIPEDRSYSWLFYGKQEKKLIKQVIQEHEKSILTELGVADENREFCRNIILSLKHMPVKNDTDKNIIQLLALISNHIDYFENQLLYKTKSKDVLTNFYINTMEASSETEELKLMSTLLRQLIITDVGFKKFPDFILTSKQGNTVLGSKFSERYDCIFLKRKGNGESSRASFTHNDTIGPLLVNFEGSRYLIEKSKNNPDKIYCGACIDCNTTSGNTLITMMDEFNDLVNNVPNILPVNDAYVLFRVTNDGDIDKRFNDKGFSLRRYLDIDEDMKNEIYQFRQTMQNSQDIYFDKDLTEIKKIVNVSIQKGLIKSQIDPSIYVPNS